MNPQLQAKWMEQGWGGGGEVVRWRREWLTVPWAATWRNGKRRQLSLVIRRLLRFSQEWPQGMAEVETGVSGAARSPRSAWPTQTSWKHLASEEPMDPEHVPWGAPEDRDAGTHAYTLWVTGWLGVIKRLYGTWPLGLLSWKDPAGMCLS